MPPDIQPQIQRRPLLLRATFVGPPALASWVAQKRSSARKARRSSTFTPMHCIKQQHMCHAMFPAPISVTKDAVHRQNVIRYEVP